MAGKIKLVARKSTYSKITVSGMYYHVVCKIGTNILAAPTVFLFSTQEIFNQKIETTGSSEMFLPIHKLCIILEHYNLGIHCHDKLKTNIITSFTK